MNRTKKDVRTENIYQYVQSNEFSLTECVDAESIM